MEGCGSLMITILSPLDYHLLEKDPGNAKCVAVKIHDGNIIGQASYHEIPHIGEIFVKEKYRREHIGQALIHRLEVIAPEYYTFPSNDASVALFQKLGLKELPDLRVFVKEK